MKNYLRNKGFSLIELILVLGLSSLIFLGALNIEKRKTETLRAEAAGQQFEEVGKALSSYISSQKSQLSAILAPNTSSPNLPITLLQGVNFGAYNGRQYLPNSYNPINALGTGYRIQIRNNGGNVLTGMVVSDAAIVDESGSVRYDWLGYAARKAGAQSGMSFFTGAQITGLNAGWVIPATDFNTISIAGQLAYRTQFQGNFDDLYLRRDGLFPMTGNLDMANHNIKDATDINYIGFLNGNNALLNNLQTAYILNNGNFQNNGNMQNNGDLTVLGTGNFNILNVTALATVGKLQLSDVVTSGGACSPTGLVSKDNTGNILSCQGGFWKSPGDGKCVSTTSNLNSLQDDGRCYNGVALPNSPAGADWVFVEVYRHVNLTVFYVAQRVIGMTGASAGRVWQRNQQSGSQGGGWGAWVQQADPSINIANNQILGRGAQGPYGATTISGEKNGWTGLEFRDSAGNYQVNQMTNRANGVGYYDAATGRWLNITDASGNQTLDQTADMASGRLQPGWAVETWGCTTGQIAKAAYTVVDGWAYNGKTLSCVNGAWKSSSGGLTPNWAASFWYNPGCGYGGPCSCPYNHVMSGTFGWWASYTDAYYLCTPLQ